MSESLHDYGTGRRKTATARVFLRPGSGEMTVNGRTLDNYFHNPTLRMIVRQPLLITETAEKLDVEATVKGGGNTGQVRSGTGSRVRWSSRIQSCASG